MTLRELIHSVDGELYADSPIYQQLLTVTPEYGSTKRIKVKLLNGEIAVTNVHLGSLGDILTYFIDVAPDLEITKIQLLDAILKELSIDGFCDSSIDGFCDSDRTDFWDEMTNLQKARILR